MALERVCWPGKGMGSFGMLTFNISMRYLDILVAVKPFLLKYFYKIISFHVRYCGESLAAVLGNVGKNVCVFFIYLNN